MSREASTVDKGQPNRVGGATVQPVGVHRDPGLWLRGTVVSRAHRYVTRKDGRQTGVIAYTINAGHAIYVIDDWDGLTATALPVGETVEWPVSVHAFLVRGSARYQLSRFHTAGQSF
jgi:hypothetical protein